MGVNFDVSPKTQLLKLNPWKTSFYRFLKIGQITLSRGPKGGSHGSKMRGGGPKLFCSPYFSIGASLVLVIMTIKYYSLSSSYDDLLLKVSVFQNQLKLTASNMRNLDASLTRKEDALNECFDEKKTVQERNKNLDLDLDKKLADLVNLQGANDEANNLVRKLQDDIDKCSDDNLTMLEELKNLRKQNEELIYNDKECQTNTAKINLLEGELNILRDQSSVLNAQNIKLKQESEAKNQQLQENLPNLDIANISIIQPAIKETNKGQKISGKWCNGALKYLDPPGPLTALASSPGSGNTWARYLIQQFTGYFTGAVYNDANLRKNGFPGEGIYDESVIAIKTHLKDFRGGNKQNQKQVPKKFDRVILLIRDPFDRLVSEWNRENSGSHTGSASLKSFSNKARWEKYVKNALNSWQEFYTFYYDNYQSENQLHIVRYENLKENLGLEMEKLMNFLNL